MKLEIYCDMDNEFLHSTAQNILLIIRSGFPVSWSWGPGVFRAVIYKGMASLRFSVNGFIHKGDVVVAYNRGADLYEVYLLDRKGKVTASNDGIYFDELVDVIDRMVEKKCSNIEYELEIGEWLENNPL